MSIVVFKHYYYYFFLKRVAFFFFFFAAYICYLFNFVFLQGCTPNKYPVRFAM